jgi:hypothetical protein
MALRRWVLPLTGFVLVAGIAAPRAPAQVGGASVGLSVGRLHHVSDLHRYFPLRFDHGAAIRLSGTLPLGRWIAVRVVAERTTTRLSGPGVYAAERREDDHLSTFEAQVLVWPVLHTRFAPWFGIGVGVRRYALHDVLVADDVVIEPFSDPQTHPIASAVVGVDTPMGRHWSLELELRASITRFRAGADSWGLPADPVAEQREWQPSVRLRYLPGGRR